MTSELPNVVAGMGGLFIARGPHTFAILIHLGFGDALAAALERHHPGWRPFVIAVRAHAEASLGALTTAAPEIRDAARDIYDDIDRILHELPSETRRRR